jgi:hypothetical protein
MKLFLAILSLAASLYIGLAIGQQGGLVKGCQAVVNTSIDSHYSPKCSLQNSKLVLQLTNPVTGITILVDVATGQEIKE